MHAEISDYALLGDTRIAALVRTCRSSTPGVSRSRWLLPRRQYPARHKAHLEEKGCRYHQWRRIKRGGGRARWLITAGRSQEIDLDYEHFV